jgi:Zinc finger C-x8-C-x5-C-x3-H type (and similar)
MVPCRFYLQGRCDRGWRCAFDHQQPENEGLSALRAVATPFTPNSDSFTIAQSSPTILFAEPCHFFSKGCCVKGATCSYRHVASASALSEQNRMSQGISDGQPDPIFSYPSQPSSKTGVSASYGPVAEESIAHGLITDTVRLRVPFAYCNGN